MKKMRMNGMDMLKRILLLGLCLALLAGSAWAEEEQSQIAGDDHAMVSYILDLPDGRMLFHKRILDDKWSEVLADTLLCVNADRTLSWEYVETDKEAGYPWQGVVRPDGTIAVLFLKEIGDEDTDPALWDDRLTLKYFTQEGEMTGNIIELPQHNAGCEVIGPDFFVLRYWENDEAFYDTMDWDGNLLEHSGDAVWYSRLEDKDGLLLYGEEQVENGRAVIMKKAGVAGELLWKTVLDFQWEMADQASVTRLVKTSDGGYAAILREREVNGFYDYQWRIALVKLDADGAVQWTNRDLFGALEESDSYSVELAAQDGKIVVCSAAEGTKWYQLEAPRVFRWVDEGGRDLGRTELVVKPEDFPEMKKLAADRDAAQIDCDFVQMDLVNGTNGPELLAQVNFYDKQTKDYNVDLGMSVIRIPVPEP
ncbi:MAG: hypothetical protein IKS46_07505 [Clostridia bacterium]|nr:hypothetical protein [Clostridia bacterium]